VQAVRDQTSPRVSGPASRRKAGSIKEILQMQPRHFEAVIFSVKAAVAAVVAARLHEFFNLPGAPWVAAVSAVLVTQTSLHSSLKASLMRVIANLAGAFGGAGLSVVLGHPLVAMAVGVMLTGLVCYILKQDDMLRPAFVAVILVTLVGETGKWRTPLDRVVAVVTGCACALAVGFLFDKISDKFKLPANDEPKKTGQE
jgi:uncharacterized membrane protein YgaE (UPF0421/DUF939 family)